MYEQAEITKEQISSSLALFSDLTDTAPLVTYLKNTVDQITYVEYQEAYSLVEKITKLKNLENIGTISNKDVHFINVLNDILNYCYQLFPRLDVHNYTFISLYHDTHEQDISLNQFIALFDQSTRIRSTPTRLEAEDLTSPQLFEFLEAMKKLPLNFPINISYEYEECDDEKVEIIENYLKSGQSCSYLSLSFNYLTLTQSKSLFEAIAGSNINENLSIIISQLENTSIVASIFECLVNAKLKKGFSLHLLEEEMLPIEAANSLAKWIKSGNLPVECGVSLFESTDEGNEIIAKAICTDEIPKHMSFCILQMDSSLATILFKKLQTCKITDGLKLTIKLSQDVINGSTGRELCNLISSSTLTQDFSISLLPASTTECNTNLNTFFDYFKAKVVNVSHTSKVTLDFSGIVPYRDSINFINFIYDFKWPINIILIGFLESSIFKAEDSLLKKIATILEKNTAIVINGIAWDMPSMLEKQKNPDMKFIKICLARNKLLAQYPQHAYLIKKFCIEKGYHKVGVDNYAMGSLKTLCSSYLFEEASNYEEIKTTLPQELQCFFSEIATVSKLMEKSYVEICEP